MTRQTIKPLLWTVAALISTGAGMALPMAAQAQPVISVQIGPPPPPRVERVPAPRRGYVWSPAYYEWMHGQYVWRRGHWVAERPGYAYVAPAWVANGLQWVYQPPRWDARAMPAPPPRYRGHGRYRDHDGDGVPNRYDRRPNNPYRY